MSQQIYRHILRDAWSATWRHPGLWFLGAFALFFGQSQFFYSLFGLMQVSAWGAEATSFFANTRHWYIPLLVADSKIQILVGLGLAALSILALVIFVFLVIQSQGALLAAGGHIFRQRAYSWKSAWHDALAHFWSLTGLLIIKFVTTLIGIVLMNLVLYLVVAHPAAVWAKIIYVIGFAILALIDILITFVALYASCFLVLEKDRFLVAIKRAYNLFVRHWLASLEIGVIFLLCNVLLQCLVKLVVTALFIPLLYFAAIVQAVTGTITQAVGISLIIMLLAAWIMSAIYSTWFFLSVVCLFDRMQSDTVVSKTIRFLRGIFTRSA